MALIDPQLDNRKFEELVTELRLRIPRYSPEYTNFNESDPGMTLVDLFAWLTEQTLFQLNQVPRKNYVKFLKLLGDSPVYAKPASADITFIPASNAPGPISVPQGTRISAQANDGNPALIFETERAVNVIGSPLDAVGALDATEPTRLTIANQTPGTKFHPFGLRPGIDSALYLGFRVPDPTPAGFNPFPQDISLFVFLPPEATAGKPVRAGELIPPPPAVVVWEAYRGESGWEKLNVFEDETAAFSRPGYIRLQGPDTVKPLHLPRFADKPLYWIRARLETAYPAGKAPQIDILRPNTVRVTNLSTERGRVLGETQGIPNDQFFLGRKSVQPDSVEIEFENSNEKWVRVEDLQGSGPTDLHFVVDASAGNLRFGDNVNGQIPPAGLTVIAKRFRYGGGARGNLAGPGSIKNLTSPITGIDKVTNERPAAGGAEELTTDELIKRGPSLVNRRNRAVTPEDFASFALEIDGVKNAVAVGSHHPNFPGALIPGAVTVFIVPDSSEQPPKASGELIRAVARRLDKVRLLTTEVHVAGPDFTEIRVEARLQVPAYASFDATARAAQKALDELLNPQTWEFGKPLHPTDVDRVLLSLNLPDIKNEVAILNRSLFVNNLPVPFEQSFEAIKLGPGGLLYGKGHLIVVEPKK